MEINQFETNNFVDEQLKLQPEAEGLLKETTKWAKFLAILSFIVLGFATLYIVFSIYMSSSLNINGYGAGVASIIGGAIIITIYGVGFYLAYLLYKFSVEISSALLNRRTSMLTEGFRKLKSYYKLSGIITIVVICFYILYFIMAGAFLASAFSGSNF